MDRRKFLATSALAPVALRSEIVGLKKTGQIAGIRPVGMKLGCQAGPLTEERLEFLCRHSVEAVCGSRASLLPCQQVPHSTQQLYDPMFP